jgi:hypothetical protein
MYQCRSLERDKRRNGTLGNERRKLYILPLHLINSFISEKLKGIQNYYNIKKLNIQNHNKYWTLGCRFCSRIFF